MPGDGSFSNLVATNQGVPLGKVSFASGEVSQAFSFASDGDGLTIAHDSLFDVQPPGFTAEFWMKGVKNQPQNLGTIVEKSHGFVDSTGWAFTGFSDSGKISFVIGAGGAGAGNFPGVVSTKDVLDGVLHHIAGTWDGSKVCMYVDSSLQGEALLSTPANNTRPVNVGYSWGGGSPNRFFRGQVDELSIYRRALSSNEVAGIFAAGSAGKSKSIPIPPTAANTFSAWVIAHQLPAGADVPAASPSGDGVPNLLKFAMGLDPKVASRASLVAPVIVSRASQKYVGLAFSHAKNATDIQLILETSSDLKTWREVAATLEKVADLDANLESVRLLENAPLNTQTARFYRLKVSLTSSRAPVAGELKLGATAEVLNAPIGPQGGTLTVNKPGDALHGLQIVVPTNTFGASTPFIISSTPIQSHTFGEAINPITPLIRVENGGQFVTNVMTVTIPIVLPPDHFAMAFIYEPGTRKLEGMPLVELSTNSITIATQHFSEFFISSILRAKLPKSADSGFRPGIDDWEFTNLGSILVPNGHCSGQSQSAMWYYYEKKLKENAPALYNRFDNDGYSFRTPNIGDDNVKGYKLASRVQRDYELVPDFADQFWNLVRLDDSHTYSSFLYSIWVTGEPQYVGIYRRGGGHAMVVYQASYGYLFVADPNYPGNPDRMIYLDPKTKKFEPYYSGANAADLGHAYPLIVYTAKTAMNDWNSLDHRWQEFENGTIGQGDFPAYTITLIDGTGTKIGTIKDSDPPTTYTTDSDRIDITHISPASGAAYYFDPTGLRLSAVNKMLALNEGLNVFGVEMVEDTADAGQAANWEWAGFKWVTINRTPKEEEPVIDYSKLREVHENRCVYYLDDNDLKQGLSQCYWDDQRTQLAERGFYQNDLREGKWTTYYKTGEILTVYPYVKGKADGPYSVYYRNGTLQERGTFRPDPDVENPAPLYRVGLVEQHWDNGNLQSTKTYVNNRIVGPWADYYPTGTLQKTGEWNDEGQRSGTYKEYSENGVQIEERNYQDGKRNGPAKTWDRDGKKIFEGGYVNDRLNGPATSYWPNGNMKSRATYVNDWPNGEEIDWWPNGNKQAEGSWNMGIETGKWTYYNEDGTVNFVRNFP